MAFEVIEPPLAVLKNRFVELAVVANILVVVALVVVERVTSLRSVKVLSPLKPLLSVRRVDEAKPERVTQESDPPLQCKLWLLPVQVVRPKPLMSVPKRCVVEALVAKKLVVVAEVEVELEAVKFWSVVEPIAVRLVVEAVTAPRVLVKKLPVVVAEVVVEFPVMMALPDTWSFSVGAVMPIPILPVDEAMVNQLLVPLYWMRKVSSTATNTSLQ
jgi:hypothetical protein